MLKCLEFTSLPLSSKLRHISPRILPNSPNVAEGFSSLTVGLISLEKTMNAEGALFGLLALSALG